MVCFCSASWDEMSAVRCAELASCGVAPPATDRGSEVRGALRAQVRATAIPLKLAADVAGLRDTRNLDAATAVLLKRARHSLNYASTLKDKFVFQFQVDL